jgi:hypothetical protein
LNVGCGARVMDGWFNIDIEHNPNAPRPPELLSDAKKIDLPDECADELMAIHVWEHFYPWECEVVIAEWRRLLKAGGKLILELPDLIKCCQNIIDDRKGKHPDQLGRWGVYGDPRTENKYMMHPWGWGQDELMDYLSQRGFSNVRALPTQFHNAGKAHRDMRIESIKA